jgi:branched-chain amino acid transport system ATP-binding protein
LFSDLTVDENLTAGGYARPISRDAGKRDRVFGYFPRLHERRTQLAGSLSGGEQQMLAIGRALMAAPRLLLVDELSLGLMPKMVDLCLDALIQLKREGLTIVLVEQNTARALDVADQVCVLASGVQVYQGTASEAKAAGSMFATFLGMNEPV